MLTLGTVGMAGLVVTAILFVRGFQAQAANNATTNTTQPSVG
jgi:hypothetical protein